MSIATPPPSVMNRPASAPHRQGPSGPPGAGPGGGAPSPLASIDPVRLLRRYYPLLILAVIVGAGLGIAAHFALLKLRPTYVSAVVYSVQPGTKTAISNEPLFLSEREQERFMATQAAIMTSEPVLAEALKNPDVENSKWAQQYVRNGALQPHDALVGLSKSISARTMGQTNLISLQMRWHDPEAVATIVNAVDRAYQNDQRLSQGRESSAKREAIGKRLNEIKEEIGRLDSQRDRLLQDGKVESIKEGLLAEESKVLKINDDIILTVQQMESTQSLLERYRVMAESAGAAQYPDELLEEATRDPVNQQFDSQITGLKTEERALRSRGFGPEHPDMIAIARRIEAAVHEKAAYEQTLMQKLFSARIDKLKSSMEAYTASIQRLEKELESAQKRREDLVRVRVRLDEIEQARERLTREQSQTELALNDMELISANDVYNRVKRIRSGSIPNEVTFPKIQVMLPLGVVLLTGLVGGLILLKEILDQRVRGPSDVTIIPRLNVLGVVPSADEDPGRPAAVETAVRDTPSSVISESFRQLRSPITKKMDQAGHKTLLVLAGMPGSGATSVAANLALSCAQADEKVLVIDANLRRPGLHKVFNLAEGPGLGDVLGGQTVAASAIQATGVRNVSVLAAGTPGSRAVPERLGGESMARLLGELSSQYDRVIIDAPPAIVSGDGFALANRCDASLLVVRALAEKRGLVARLRTQLGDCRAELLGVVVNGVRASAGGYFKRNIQATHEYQSAQS